MAPASAASVPTDTATTKSTSKASATVVTSTTGATAKKTTGSKSSAKTVTKATGAGTKAKKPARKKKTTTKPSTSGANNQIYAQSRAAQQDLAAQRNAAAIRMSDPLWYKLEDYVLPAVEKESVMSEISAQILPEQVQIVEMALDKNNLTRADITPQAFACLLEQARRYAIDILSDSQDYAFVANRVEITKADLALANEFRPEHSTSITAQLPKLNLLAQSINRIPLPPIPTQCYSGVILPSKRYQLTARTFDVVTSGQTAKRMVQAVPTISPLTAAKVNSNQSSNRRASAANSTKKNANKKKLPNYGARTGARQIAISLKGDNSKEAVLKKE